MWVSVYASIFKRTCSALQNDLFQCKRTRPCLTFVYCYLLACCRRRRILQSCASSSESYHCWVKSCWLLKTSIQHSASICADDWFLCFHNALADQQVLSEVSWTLFDASCSVTINIGLWWFIYFYWFESGYSDEDHVLVLAGGVLLVEGCQVRIKGNFKWNLEIFDFEGRGATRHSYTATRYGW